MMKPIPNYRNWQHKLDTIENPALNLSVETLRDNTYENYMFGDLYFFALHHIPAKPNMDTLAAQLEKSLSKVTTDEGMQAWYEHDAIHYLSQQTFSADGERCVKFIEKKFWRGWSPHGEEYNSWVPVECDCSYITQELITETASLIKEHHEMYKTFDYTYNWKLRYIRTPD